MALVDSFRGLKPGSRSEEIINTDDAALAEFRDALSGPIAEALADLSPKFAKRAELSAKIKDVIQVEARKRGQKLSLLQERNLITVHLNAWLVTAERRAPLVEQSDPGTRHRELQNETLQSLAQQRATRPMPHAQSTPAPAAKTIEDILGPKEERAQAVEEQQKNPAVASAADAVRDGLTERMDIAVAAKMPRGELAGQITSLVGELLREKQIQLNSAEQRDLVTILVNDMLGLGPLEPLLSDPSVTDIMVNGPNQVYVERKGKLTLTDVCFRDGKHLLSICTRIVSRIGRRVDESSPMCDARLEDGSRVNIIIPPLALDGASVSIRKFAEKKITLDMMSAQGNISSAMETVLKIAGRARLNIVISGGTGSGKTTTLNALSRMVDQGERVVTIEDAAELQLQQPHVVRLETRPANLEGKGEITMRDLVKNALRMRPDRIILGEIRGGEAIDMLQAMNTGHDGSMCTLHANNPREALTRLENMVSMAGFNLPPKAMRQQIASAVDMIVQVSRMRDGKRRITSITEVVGMEGEIVTTQELFSFKFKGEDPQGNLIGEFAPGGVRPHFSEQASYFGLEKPLLEAVA